MSHPETSVEEYRKMTCVWWFCLRGSFASLKNEKVDEAKRKRVVWVAGAGLWPGGLDR
jgi:hypothetical protein